MKNLEIKKLVDKIIEFRKERNWEQFHNPKDIALSLVLESVEVLEHFQWKDKEEVEQYIKTAKAKKEISEELADVLYWVLLMSHDLKIDVLSTLSDKIQENKEKYPVEKAKGRHTKYTDL